jgi:hypothetical protein
MKKTILQKAVLLSAKMKNANFKKLLLLSVILLILLVSASCSRIKDFSGSIPGDFPLRQETNGTHVKESAATTIDNLLQDDKKSISLIFFDYEKIKTDITTSIGVKIKNTNVFLDHFGNLCVMGEILNLSNSTKTNILLTIDFLDKKGSNIYSDKIGVNTNYLRPDSKIPFTYMLSDNNKYIGVDTIKIGVNYKDYYKLLKSNIIVNKENFTYKNDILTINGKIVNIGESKAVNINLLSTFYDMRDRVVQVRKCFIKESELLPKEEQDFSLNVLFSKYAEDFTHYDFEVFFEDSVEMP